MSKLQDKLGKHSHNSGCFELYLDFKSSVITRNSQRKREKERRRKREREREREREWIFAMN